MTLDEVARILSTDPAVGLSGDEARRRYLIHGPNAIPKARGNFWQVYLAPIFNWLINIYLISSFALLMIALLFPTPENDISQAMLWLSVVAVNCVVAIFQQFRAQKKLEALERLSAGESRVIRSGQEERVSPVDIVPGDIVRIEQGDRVPADGRLITSSNLTINEASLTGESIPVVKDHTVIADPDAPLTDMVNSVFLGTYVATGTGRFLVTRTGPRTEIGRIQGALAALNTGDIPLRKKVNQLAKYLGLIAIVLMFLSVLWTLVVVPLIVSQTIILDPLAISIQLSAGISNAMTIMPINIPLLTTIVLLTGVLAMAKKKVIVRDLSAVESLGRVSVICSDKTGTMTRNEMQVRLIWDTVNLYHVEGEGYSPEGVFSVVNEDTGMGTPSQDQLKPIRVSDYPVLTRLLICGAINNDSEIDSTPEGSSWRPMGDPTDAAILTAFRRAQFDEKLIRDRFQVIADFPFDSSLKRMSKVCREDGKYVSFVKGATEVLLGRCSRITSERGPVRFTADLLRRVSELTMSYSEKGYRVISFAYRDMTPSSETSITRDEAESDLTYMGFVCIVDPPREGVRDAVSACHSAGIQVVMITGDSAGTAKTIATDLGILSDNSLVVEGRDIEDLTPDEFARVNVFARVNPEHKQLIVERYQEQDRVVAMTGDGVNDALALAMSDTGIAMGISGTDVAKEAADIVIADDSFTSIVEGVRHGRGLFSKIRAMVYFYVAINVAEAIVFFSALLFMPVVDLFYNNWQNLYLVVTTHTFPGLALVFDKVSPRVMQERPRNSEEILTRPLVKFMGLNILLMSSCIGFVYWLTVTGVFGPAEGELLSTGRYYVPKATIMMLTVILIVESSLVFVIRRINLPVTTAVREPGVFRYIFLLSLIYLAHLLLMYVPVVQDILQARGLVFRFVPLTDIDWVFCITVGSIPLIGMELYKRSLRRRGVTL
ncbi:MAG: cation-transporting P-type ATPase [Candidatus Thorarchaeota archaeon]